jgi:segregation and condensation protein A
MPERRYEVKVENIFEGPMDLLVYLIHKNEVDIYDIPIAMITEQYLEYIAWMKIMNVDFAGDFLLMAATLTQIKSKMLLPVHDGDGEEEEDPRLEITRPLIEYLRMKSAAEELNHRPVLGEDTFLRAPGAEEIKLDPADRFIQVSLFELIDAFQRVIERMPGEHAVDFDTERFSIKDKIAHIIEVLEEKGSVTFHELFSRDAEKEELIATFLALLEMGRLGLVRIAQHYPNGTIRLFYL